MTAPSKYAAFISYRRVNPDQRFAAWLAREIETYRVPEALRRKYNLPLRLGRVFLDEDELAAPPDLARELKARLVESASLIVVCSPRTREKRWVEFELAEFRRLKPSAPILALLVEGEPAEAFPPGLRLPAAEPGGSVVEPLAGDVRPLEGESPRRRKQLAALRIIASMLGCEFDELRRRDDERRYARNVRLALVATAIAVSLAALSIIALFQRDAAQEQLYRLVVANGVQMLDGDDALGALPWFAEAVRLKEARWFGDARVDRERMASALRTLPRLSSVVTYAGGVSHVTFSPDGRHLATASLGGDSRLINLQTGEQRRIAVDTAAPASPAQDVAFSGDGSRLVIVEEADNEEAERLRARVLDSETLQPVSPILEFEDSWHRVHLNPTGTRLLTPGQVVQVWDVESGNAVVRIPLSEGFQGLAVFSRDGRLLATGTADGEVSIWDAETGARVSGPMTHENLVQRGESGAGITGLHFSPDGSLIASASAGGAAQVWHAASGRPRTAPLVHSTSYGAVPVVSVEFSPEGDSLLTSDTDGRAHLWDVETGEPRRGAIHHVRSDTAQSLRATYAPESQRFATAGDNQLAQVWDAASGDAVTPPLPHTGPIKGLALSPDGGRLATASGDGLVRVYELASTEPVMRHIPPGSGLWTGGAFDPSHPRLALVDFKGHLAVWGLEAQRQLSASEVLEVRAADLRWIGSRLIMSDEGGSRGWTVSTTGVLAPDPVLEAGALTVSEEGELALTGLRITHARTGAAIATLSPEVAGSTLLSAAFSREGRRLVASNGQATARIFNTTTGQAVGKPLVHPTPEVALEGPFQFTPIPDVRFSPDGSSIATASWDESARLWDANSGEPLTPPLRHAGLVERVVFSRDGARLAAVAGSGIRVWDVRTGLLASVNLRMPARFMDASFNGRGQLLAVDEKGNVATWSRAPAEEPAEELARLAALLAGRRLDSTGGLVRLLPGQFRELAAPAH